MDEFDALFSDIGALDMQAVKRDLMDFGAMAVGAVGGSVAWGLLDKNALQKVAALQGAGTGAAVVRGALPIAGALALNAFVGPKMGYGRGKQMFQGACLGLFILGVRAFYQMARSKVPALPELSGLGADEALLTDPFQKYLSGFGEASAMAPMTAEEVDGLGQGAPTTAEEVISGLAGTLTA